MNKKKLIIVEVILLLLTVGPALTLLYSQSNQKVDKQNIVIAADTILSQLKNELSITYDCWYPLSVDKEYGGFFSDIDYKWEISGSQNKMIVTQARHVWAASRAGLFYNERKRFLQIAEHGFKFLRDVMWDKQYGGFYDLVKREGDPVTENGEIIKRVYGQAFAIYGLSEYYEYTKNTEALDLAKKTFQWIDEHSYDTEFGGYFQFMKRDGTPIPDGYRGTPPKDQNSAIHILEALTQLYKVWPDKIVEKRLTEIFHLVRDKLVTDKGYLNLFFDREWNHVSNKNKSRKTIIDNFYFDHVSFGHDIEVAYLLLEAAEQLGMKDDPATLTISKKMVDHSIDKGWDVKDGGLFDGGYYFKGDDTISIVQKTKEWWAQAETLNSLLLMSKLFPNDKNYYSKFCDQWEFIKKYLIDHKYGGWYWGGIDIVPANKFSPKSSIWKADYHTTRALINCIQMLKNR